MPGAIGSAHHVLLIATLPATASTCGGSPAFLEPVSTLFVNGGQVFLFQCRPGLGQGLHAVGQ